MPAERSEILQGTPDRIVLKTPDTRGSLHGYGVARRIEQISEEALRINQGTIHASHVRVLQNGWITGVWSVSRNNRQAKFYSISKSGRKQLNAEAENWERVVSVIGRVLRVERG
jgi:transcriptional regulator